MKNLKKSHLILISAAVLLLLGCGGMTAYLLFSNYQTVRLFKQAQINFQRQDAESLKIAEAQLLQVISKDDDNEAAYIMLGEIAAIGKNYPEQVYYCYMAHRLNPLNEQNKARYINSLAMARYFDRLENFLAQQQDLTDEWHQMLLYAAGHNGNINKHKQQLSRRSNDNRIGELALLLFKHNHLKNQEKLWAVEKIKTPNNAFLQQELLAAETELALSERDLDRAEKVLQQACELNEFAFAPVLGRFYAQYRSFGKALAVLEKYLDEYHDPKVAMQTAEIYCLLNRTDKIAELRTDFQTDTGDLAMVCSYYFDALIALAKNDMSALKDLTVPLRNILNTQLANFMFFCVDLHNNDLAALKESYTGLTGKPTYLDLQKRADDMLNNYIKHALGNKKVPAEQLLELAELLYKRKADIFTAKFILLMQKMV